MQYAKPKADLALTARREKVFCRLIPSKPQPGVNCDAVSKNPMSGTYGYVGGHMHSSVHAVDFTGLELAFFLSWGKGLVRTEP